MQVIYKYCTYVAIVNVLYMQCCLQMCKCDPSSTKRCFQWTVVIDQLDYAKTRRDNCPPTGTRSIKSSIGPVHDKAIVAKIYIQQQSLTSSPTTSAGENALECFRTTANAAITAALPQLNTSRYVSCSCAK